MDNINEFSIAELHVRIIFKKSAYNDMRLLPSFEPFRISESHDELFFQLTIDDSLKPIAKERRERIRKFDTGKR
jgi:hypothetical protein